MFKTSAQAAVQEVVVYVSNVCVPGSGPGRPWTDRLAEDIRKLQTKPGPRACKRGPILSAKIPKRRPNWRRRVAHTHRQDVNVHFKDICCLSSPSPKRVWHIGGSPLSAYPSHAGPRISDPLDESLNRIRSVFLLAVGAVLRTRCPSLEDDT
jgi:hypothetical protein